MKRIHALVTAAWLAASPCLWAASIPADLLITAGVSVDAVNSQAAGGGASQSGSIRLIQSGLGSPQAFGNDPSAMATPALSGLLAATGDGISGQMSQQGSGSGAQTDALFIDFGFSLLNSGASSYTVNFRALFTNTPNASGDDAFAQAQVEILDSALNILLFNDEERDTLFGNFSGGGAGGLFSFLLNPGDSLSFSGLLQARGGSFSANGAYANELFASVLVDSVVGGPIRPVPLPGSLALGLLALALLGPRLRRV